MLSPTFSWKQETHEVALRDGTDIKGTSLKGPTIQVSGGANIDGSAGTPTVTTIEQIRMLHVLMEFMKVVPTDGYLLIYYWSGVYPAVHQKRVFPTSFTYDNGDDQRIHVPYTFSFMAEDPAIYFNVNASDVYNGTATQYGPSFSGTP